MANGIMMRTISSIWCEYALERLGRNITMQRSASGRDLSTRSCEVGCLAGA
jgi:hypothetical protein